MLRLVLSTIFKKVLFLIILTGYCALAQQGNYKFNNFGNRTILLGGNVTGSVEDFGLAYYNPARLTEIENNGFAFNAKAYEYSTYKLKNAIDENSAPKDSQFSAIPTTAAGTFSLFGTRFAYSFFTKYATNARLNYRTGIIEDDLVDILPGQERYTIDFLVNNVLNEQLIGLTWAHAINEKFSLGISVFGSVYKYEGGTNLEYSIQAEDNRVAYYQNRPNFRQDSYGLVVKIGASYHFPKFDFGVNINVPYLEVFHKGRFNYQKIISGISPDNDQLYNYKLDNLNANRKEPLGVSLGAGIPIKTHTLHVNLDYVLGLSPYSRLEVPDIDTGNDDLTSISFEERRRSVINFGVGGEFYLNEFVNLYTGFSTDFNALSTDSDVLEVEGNPAINSDFGSDYIHASMGAELKLKWANLILGATHTRSTTDFLSPSSIPSDDLNIAEDTHAVLSFTRWQFIVGLDIPFLNKKVNDVLKGKTTE